MNSILEIWTDLEKANTSVFLKKLYSNDTNQCVYGIFKNPEKYCGIGISVSKDIHIDISPFSKLLDLKVSLFNDSSFDNHVMLIIELLDYSSRDVFSILCEDLIITVSKLFSEQSSKVYLENFVFYKSIYHITLTKLPY